MGLDIHVAHYLVSCYGKQTDIILEKMKRFDDADVHLKLLKSELHFTIENEMICHSSDFFIRRTGRLYFDIHSVIKYQQEITLELGKILGWTETQLNEDRQLLQMAIEGAKHFLKE